MLPNSTTGARRTLQDDGRGLDEALDDQSVITVRTSMYVGELAHGEAERAFWVARTNNPLLTFEVTGGAAVAAKARVGMPGTLPFALEVHALQFVWAATGGERLRLRLFHQHQGREANALARPVSVDLGGLFDLGGGNDGDPGSWVEMSLTGHARADACARKTWRTSDPDNFRRRTVETDGDAAGDAAVRDGGGGGAGPVVVVKPMQLRTFELQLP